MRILRRGFPASALHAGVMVLTLTGFLLAQSTQDEPSDKTHGQTQETVYKVGKDGVTAPRTIYAPSPEFSEQARRAKYQGTVTLMATVSANGDVTAVRVVSTAGMGLDEKAMEAVRRWKFKPAKKDGKPVAVEVAVEASFTLPTPRK